MKDLSRLIEHNELEFATEFTDGIIQIKSIIDTKAVVEVMFIRYSSLNFLFYIYGRQTYSFLNIFL